MEGCHCLRVLDLPCTPGLIGGLACVQVIDVDKISLIRPCFSWLTDVFDCLVSIPFIVF